MNATLLAAIAALGSAVAAFVSLFVAWRSPKSAAAFAEELRSQNERTSEIRRLKLYIFTEIMKARGIQITRDSVGAFNLIDLVYKDNTDVRDAWAELYSGYNRIHNVPQAYIDQSLTKLLRAMAQDLGLSGDLRSADFERYYYPTALAEEDRARSLHQKAFLQQIERTQKNEDAPSLFPPRPSPE